MTIAQRLAGRGSGERNLSVDDWLGQFVAFMGQTYAAGPTTTLSGNAEAIANDFTSYARGAYYGNGAVFACLAVRMRLFSEARFQFRQIRNGRPGDLFGTPALAPLERPWKNATTGDLLTRMILDHDLAGNSYTALVGRELRRLRPDWVDILLGSPSGDPHDVEIAGYAYTRGGKARGGTPEIFLPEEIAHFATTPDPLAEFRGMSWLTPVIREVQGDTAASNHKLKFFDNGAVPSMIVKLSEAVKKDAFDAWVAKFKAGHEGAENAYKTIYLGGGADATVVGSDMKQIDFKVTQGAGETRIAAAAGVPPIIVGFSEGLAAATYCLPAEERVWTLDGPRSIADVRRGDEVWSSGGDPSRPARVTWQGCVGEKMVYAVRTKNRTLLATDNHPVLVRVAGHSRGGNSSRAPRVEWRSIGDLRPGDQVVEALSLPDAGGVQPEWASTELAQWLGAYVGDGSGAGKGGISLAIPPTDRVRAKYEALTADLFDVRIGYEPRSFRFHGKGVSELIATLGFAGTAKTKRLPGWVFRLPLEKRLAFLAGLIDTDGHVDRRGVGTIGFANRELVEQVRALCWSCGVQTSNVQYRRQMASGLPNPGLHEAYDFWAIALTTGLGAVPTADPMYRERLANRRDAREGGDAWKAGLDERLGFFTVRSIEARGVEPVYDISVEGTQAFFAGGVAVHNSNYGQARRALADGTLRPLWRNASGSLASIITVPGGAELWYDARDVSFLQEDEKDAADIHAVDAQSIRTLTDAGFEPDSVVKAVTSGDMTQLVHSGMLPVQLWVPGQNPTSPESPSHPGGAPVVPATP